MKKVFLFYKNKRGISAVVATVLIILITVAAVAIVWSVVMPMVRESLDFSAMEASVYVVSDYTTYDSSRGLASVQVHRDSDDGVMERVKIIFDFEGNSYSSTVVAPSSGNSRVYFFDVSSIGVPDSVSVVPLLSNGKKEKDGNPSGNVKVGEGKVNNAAVVLKVGMEYESDLNDGLVAYWKFDDLTDSAGNYDLTKSSSASITIFNGDNVGYSSGNGAYFYYTPGPSLAPKMNSFSYSFWIYPMSFTSSPDWTSGARFFWQGNWYSDCSTNSNCRYNLVQITSSGKLQTSAYDSGVGSFGTTTSITLSINNWYHVVYVVDRESGEYNLYINGELEKSGTVSSNINLDMTDSFMVPSYWAEMKGYYDNIMIYNKVLNEGDVEVIYEMQKK